MPSLTRKQRMMKRQRDRWASDSDSDQEARPKKKIEADTKPSDTVETAPSAPSDHPFAASDGGPVSVPVLSPSSVPNQESIAKPISNHTVPRLWESCRSVESYARIGRIDEGTYGVVSKAKDKETGAIVALKQVKLEVGNVTQEGFPITALRETNVLLALDHPNIIKVREVVVGSTPDKIYMVMDYASNDLKTILSTKVQHPFLQSESKYLIKCVLQAVGHMHRNGFIHRDLKTSNLLYDSQAYLKLCDFGLARKYEKVPDKYTSLVVTLWYRAPELLLGETTYSTAVDMWSVGCIFAEILLRQALFPGKGELDQMDRIFRLLGAPNEENWPGVNSLPNVNKFSNRSKWPSKSHLRDKFPVTASFIGDSSMLSSTGFDLLSRMLTLDPKQRITAAEALDHPFFQESPAPLLREHMPTFN